MALVVRDLRKRLGGHTAVDDVSFEVQDGEFFVLLGPSGGGKSTLLRLLCGLETPDGGSITVGERDITGLPPRQRDVGMVFQDYGLYPNMNVHDNIAYGLTARNLPRAEVARRVPEAAAKVGLSEFLQRSVLDLSGGEQQRVALARALAKDAAFYLYDEPLSNLDPKLRFSARRDILKVHRDKGKPSVYVTHDQAEAFALGDRIAVMGQGGKLQQIGTPEDLLDRPANLFVARFIGSPPMNLLHGRLLRGTPHRFVGEGFDLALPESANAPLSSYAGERLVLGVRPDALRVAETGLRGRVVNLELLLGETALRLELSPQNALHAVLSDEAAGEREFELGETVTLLPDPDRLALFDPDSEGAL